MASPSANAPIPGRSPPLIGGMPPALTPLIGREDDIAAVGTLVRRDGVRLLTLIGPGGVGKTRLAMEVARQASGDAFGRVGFAPLAALQNPDLVPQAIARALEIPAAADQAVLARVREAIAGRRVLLVLDNLEHLPAAGPIVLELVANCPNLTVLGTSRARLNLSGERLYPVHPLGTPAAVSLFVQRGETVTPDLHLDMATRPTIEAICLRIDGLPLAIELAAARLTVLSLPELLTRLAHPLPLLTGGPQDAPDRQRTMRNVIAWSYDLLPPPAQCLFRRLGVFVGGFTLAAATQVADTGDEVLDVLEALLTSSLVRRAPAVGGVGRFTMLETIREFALEQLAASGEERAIRHRHAAYLAVAMEREFSLQEGPEVRAAHDRIEADLQNSRAALAWCVEQHEAEIGMRIAGAISRTWWYGHANGDRPWHEHLAEGRHWLEQTLAMRESVPLGSQVLALSGASAFAAAMGDHVAAGEVATDLLARSQEEGNALGIFWGHFRLGIAASLAEDHETARDHLLAALAASPELACPESRISQMHAFLAQAEERLGAIPAARARLEAAMPLARRSANPFAICLAGSHLGRLLRETGELARATEVQAEVVAGYLAQRNLAGVAQSLSELALIAQAGGFPERSQWFLAMARQLPGDDEDPATVHRQRVPTGDSLSEVAFIAAWDAGAGLDPDAMFVEIAGLVTALADARLEPVTPPEDSRFGLTRREREVLQLLAEGRSNRAIAEELSLSERTVEHHLLHVYGKLGLESRAAAVAFALRHELA